MSVRVIREHQTAKLEEWPRLLGFASPDVLALVDRGVLSPTSDKYRLDFVGVLVGAREAVACAPKFWAKGQTGVISFVTRVLGRYFTSETKKDRGDTIAELTYRDQLAFRELDALQTLVTIFAQRGLISRDYDDWDRSGRVDWIRTLAQSAPVVTGLSVIYPDPVRVRRARGLTEVSALQAMLTENLLEKYEMPVPAELRTATISLSPLLSMPVNTSSGRSYYWRMLDREQGRIFRTDDLALVQTLKGLLNSLEGLAGQKSVSLYGTNAFYSVWEDALRSWFGNESETTPLAQPIWRPWFGGQWQPAIPGAKQRPDCIARVGDILAILDAKYHFPFPAALPGWADLVKQIYYGESLAFTGEVINAFVLPDPSVADLDFRGIVEVNGGPRTFPCIEVWVANPHLVFNEYTSRRLDAPRTARDLFMARRREMVEVIGDPKARVR